MGPINVLVNVLSILALRLVSVVSLIWQLAHSLQCILDFNGLECSFQHGVCVNGNGVGTAVTAIWLVSWARS